MCSAARLARRSGSSSFDDYPGYLMSLLSTMLSERSLIIAIIVTTGNIWPTTTWFTTTSKLSLRRKLTDSASRGDHLHPVIPNSSSYSHYRMSRELGQLKSANEEIQQLCSVKVIILVLKIFDIFALTKYIYENKLLSGNG